VLQTGRNGNVISVTPPLVIGRDDLDARSTCWKTQSPKLEGHLERTYRVASSAAASA